MSLQVDKVKSVWGDALQKIYSKCWNCLKKIDSNSFESPYCSKKCEIQSIIKRGQLIIGIKRRW